MLQKHFNRSLSSYGQALQPKLRFLSPKRLAYERTETMFARINKTKETPWLILRVKL